jgi:hypothetical protein
MTAVPALTIERTDLALPGVGTYIILRPETWHCGPTAAAGAVFSGSRGADWTFSPDRAAPPASLAASGTSDSFYSGPRGFPDQTP